MKIVKTLSIICIVFLSFNSADAQKKSRFPHKTRFELGGFVGSTNYSGDLEPNGVNIAHSLLGYGGFIRCNITNNFSVRFGLDAGTITDADSFSDVKWRKRRNLNFTTTIFNGYIAAEYYVANLNLGSGKFISPYLLLGVGAFHFNPRTQYKGVGYDLQPLGTEGQGTLEYPDRLPYALNQIFIPIGGGLRFTLNNTWFIGLELRANKTFTDYLDDVSSTYASPDVLKAQAGDIAVALGNRITEKYPKYPDVTGQGRGNSKNLDWYYFTGITISHVLAKKSHCYTF